MAEYSHETLELFAEIGSRLRSAREERGYSLQELSAHTRIHQNFLEKIESGDLAALPGMAFVKGFIRNYIQVLQIDDGELEEQLQRLGIERRADPAANLRPSNPQLLDTTAERPSRLRLALIVVVVVLLGWLGYVFFRPGETPTPPAGGEATATAPAPETPAAGGPGATPPAAPAETPAAPAPAAPAESPAAAPAATTPASPTGTPAGTTPGAAATGPGAPAGPPGAPPLTGGPVEGRQKLELTLRGLEPSWVRLSIDRAPAVDIFLQPAETVAWEANQEFQLVIGKSKAVAVYLNGEEYPLPQEPNRLIPNLVLNKLTLLRLEN